MRSNEIDKLLNNRTSIADSFVAKAMHEKKIQDQEISPIEEMNAFLTRYVQTIDLQIDLIRNHIEHQGDHVFSDEEAVRLNHAYLSELNQLCHEVFYPNLETQLLNRFYYNPADDTFSKLNEREREARRLGLQSEIDIYQNNLFHSGQLPSNIKNTLEVLRQDIGTKIIYIQDQKVEIITPFGESEEIYRQEHADVLDAFTKAKQQKNNEVGSLAEQGRLDELKATLKVLGSKRKQLEILHKESGIHAMPALHAACFGTQTEVIRYLLKLGVISMQLCSQNKSAAHYAIMNQSARTAETLTLLASVPGLLNLNQKYARNLLQLSCEYGNLAAVEWLIREGIFRINHQDTQYGKTALQYAVDPGIHAWTPERSAIVELLLKNGANPHIENSCGETALVSACIRQHTECISCFLSNGFTLRQVDIRYLKQEKLWSGLSPTIREFVNQSAKLLSQDFSMSRLSISDHANALFSCDRASSSRDSVVLQIHQS